MLLYYTVNWLCIIISNVIYFIFLIKLELELELEPLTGSSTQNDIIDPTKNQTLFQGPMLTMPWWYHHDTNPNDLQTATQALRPPGHSKFLPFPHRCLRREEIWANNRNSFDATCHLERLTPHTWRWFIHPGLTFLLLAIVHPNAHIFKHISQSWGSNLQSGDQGIRENRQLHLPKDAFSSGVFRRCPLMRLRQESKQDFAHEHQTSGKEAMRGAKYWKARSSWMSMKR